jgi:hypothetical protein
MVPQYSPITRRSHHQTFPTFTVLARTCFSTTSKRADTLAKRRYFTPNNAHLISVCARTTVALSIVNVRRAIMQPLPSREVQRIPERGDDQFASASRQHEPS